MAIKKPSDGFSTDETVQRLLAAWARERDSDAGRRNLARGMSRLSTEQRVQLIERLAEISLGLLFVLLRGQKGL